MKYYLSAFMQGKNLTRSEAYSIFSRLSTYPLALQAAFIVLLTKKKESEAELLGMLDFMLEQSEPICSSYDAVDIVGTGGDAIGTFNISTAASLVIASCGVYVAKHGGRSVTSQSGSTDVLEALGIPVCRTSEACITGLETQGYTYMWGALFNPALRSFAALRKSLDIPTVFNILGPLLNPMQLKRQVIGVSRPDLLQSMASILKKKGSSHALVVHSDDGMDELSVSAATQVLELRHGKIKKYRLLPHEVGLNQSSLCDVAGGTALENAGIIRGIFEGRISGAPLDIVLLNSAAGLLVADKVAHLREGVDMARMAIASGKTAFFVNQLQS